MSKRAAEVQLTQDNLDDEYDASEEAGQFEVASEEQLKQRVIKKAKRGRVLGDGGSSGGIFAGLTTSQPLTLEKQSLTPPPSGPAPVINSPPKQDSTPYLVQLKSLNESVSEWIQKHVSDNPYVDLTPIFKDYTTHLAGIETKHKSYVKVDDEDSQGSESREKETDTEATEDSQATDSPPSVSESQEESSAQGEDTPSQSGDEDSCLMSVRAKLFYKKGSGYTELGVGTLKVQSSSTKAVRLLLRNDTSLSKVLLNVRVTSDIPISSKNNNVFVVCVPNPPLSKDNIDTPVSYLIRVKTSPLADKLVTRLKENTS